MRSLFIFETITIASIACFLQMGGLKADDASSFEERRSLFHYSKSQGLLGQVLYNQDLIVLRNGTLLRGELKSLPAILSLNQVFFLSKEADQRAKWKVKTFKGNEDFSPLTEMVFEFVEYIPEKGGVVSKKVKTIPGEDVDFVLLKMEEEYFPEKEEHSIKEASKSKKTAPDISLSVSFITPSQSPLPLNSEMAFAIPKVEFFKDPEPLFAESDEVFLEEVEFLEDPAPLLTEFDEVFTEEIEWTPFSEELDEAPVEEVAFLGDPFSLLAEVNQSSFLEEPSPLQETDEEYAGYIRVKDGKRAFYIQKRLVLNKEYKEFVDAVNYKPPLNWTDGQIPSSQEESPVVNVSYKDAFLYSVWKQKRLPEVTELAAASKKNAHFKESTYGLNEWTSTPYEKSFASQKKEGLPSVAIEKTAFSQHIIWGVDDLKPMLNSEYNSKTGFRLTF